jgi:hypothetical protein
MMKTVISISLGSSTRDVDQIMLFNNYQVRVIRKGTDGDTSLAGKLIKEYDGNIPFIGLGGVNKYYQWGKHKYPCPLGIKLANLAKNSKVVDGASIKKVFDKQAFNLLTAHTCLSTKKVLIVSVLDRPHLVEFCEAEACSYIIGDAIFALKLPLPIYSQRLFGVAARFAMPFLRQIPLQYLYPTGSRQDNIKPGYASRYVKTADIICGDFHLFKRQMPAELNNKIILASTVTRRDTVLVQERGASALVTSSPYMYGRALGANLWEAVLSTLNKRLLTEQEVEKIVYELNIQPSILRFKAKL